MTLTSTDKALPPPDEALQQLNSTGVASSSHTVD
jgi:hypothetical protein